MDDASASSLQLPDSFIYFLRRSLQSLLELASRLVLTQRFSTTPALRGAVFLIRLYPTLFPSPSLCKELSFLRRSGCAALLILEPSPFFLLVSCLAVLDSRCASACYTPFPSLFPLQRREPTKVSQNGPSQISPPPLGKPAWENPCLHYIGRRFLFAL